MAESFANLRVGVQKTSTLDFPGTVATTIFFTGCSLRCPFCHNPLLARGLTPLDFRPLDEVLSLIERRASVIGGVCLTGGEPLLQSMLPEIVARIHSFGLSVKLDTNGLTPDKLSQISVDYTALDLKTAPPRYSELFGADSPQVELPTDSQGRAVNEASESDLFGAVRRTMEYLRSAGRAYEYRTTVVPGLVGEEEILDLCSEVMAGEHWFLQRFRPDSALSPQYRALPPPSTADLHRMRDFAVKRGIVCEVRGPNE